MTHWFRMYDEFLNDPKVQTLPLEHFKIWVNCLCLASARGHADGNIGTLDDVSFALRETKEAVSCAFHELLILRFIVTVDGTFHVNGWQKRQYKSDTSTERVKKYRKRSKTVTETAPEQSRTDTDTEQKEATLSSVAARAPTPPVDEKIKSEFQKIYDAGCAVFPSLATASTASIHQWIAAGCDAERDAVPEIERHSRADKAVRSWSYFTGSIMDAKAKRTTPLPESKQNLHGESDFEMQQRILREL